jgi:hypothetical protein
MAASLTAVRASDCVFTDVLEEGVGGLVEGRDVEG